jgi:hypothetical protein
MHLELLSVCGERGRAGGAFGLTMPGDSQPAPLTCSLAAHSS